MSLTNIVYTPVDTGTAKVRPKGEKAKGRFFYLLAGKLNSYLASVVPILRDTIRRFLHHSFFDLILHLLLHLEKERRCKSLIIFESCTSTLTLDSPKMLPLQEHSDR